MSDSLLALLLTETTLLLIVFHLTFTFHITFTARLHIARPFVYVLSRLLQPSLVT